MEWELCLVQKQPRLAQFWPRLVQVQEHLQEPCAVKQET